MTAFRPASRLQAYIQFLAALLYFFFAQSLASRAAAVLVTELWRPIAERATLAFLLIAGYAGLGYWLSHESQPVSQQGLSLREGWKQEAGIGLAAGWAFAVVCVLAMAVFGGIAILLDARLAAFGWLAVDAVFFGLAALVEEVAFRGYGFQRFVQAVGPLGAAIGFAAFYAIVQTTLPGSNRASIAVSVALSLVLSTAYLRTGALWVSWGINFGWKASQALVFGLAISGDNSRSPVVQGNPMGPFWLTGGGYGLNGSWLAFFVLLAAIPVVYRLTRDLDYRYNAPVFVPGGTPVDLGAIARSQHDAAMGTQEPSAPKLVQILPATPIPPPSGPASSQNLPSI